MNLKRTTPRGVLRDKRGLTTSMPEVLAGMSLRVVTMAAVGGVLATGLAFWAMTQASADTSSSFQNVNVRFEKAVHASDVVVGMDSNRVGLLTNVDGDHCEVQTWQNGTRDGKTTLQVDTEVVDEVCSPTTPLSAPATTDAGIELLFNIETPSFAYANLGGREITFDSDANPTLTTGTKPEGIKQADFDDVRPFKVSLALKALDEDNSANTQKAVATGFTNVLNVSEVKEEDSYVPAPSDDVVPGPLRITATGRSTTTGATFANTREGVAVSFNGGVCTSGPTKVDVSFSQQTPAEAPRVNTVLNSVLTGDTTTVHLGSVPNGSSGLVEVAATCSEGGVVVKDTAIYTQQIPATELKVVADASKATVHNLTWSQVSSLPTTFEVYSVRGSDAAGIDSAANLIATLPALTHQVDTAGKSLGITTTYGVVGIVDENRSPVATSSIDTPLPKPGATTVTTKPGGATWDAVACAPYSTAQYSVRSNTVYGTGFWINPPWTAWSDWSTELKTARETPEFGRTTYEVQSRCAADETDASSESETSQQRAFFVPEAATTTVARSTTAGTLYSGAREGALVSVQGARCYGGAETTLVTSWKPKAPSGQTPQSVSATEKRGSLATTSNLAGVANGADGSISVTASCVVTNGATDTVTTDKAYSQPIPTPILTVTQGANGDQHKLTWTQVSSLPTSFGAFKYADWGDENMLPDETSALTQTLTYVPGTNYGNKTTYVVSAMLNGKTSLSAEKPITTPWPTVPKAQSVAWTQGTGNSGTLRWSYNGTCPAGTTLKGQQHENRTGQSNGTFSTAIRATSPWTTSPTSYAWKAPYALNGYAYQMGVDSKCVSNVTGFESSVQSTQSGNFVMPMVTPAKPVWNAFNFRDYVRGTNWTYSTCFAGGCPSIQIDYITYCSAGSSVNWSNFTSTDWNPASYNHAFGWQDNWHLTAGTRNVTYHNAKYSCSTPWAVSPQSAAGNSVVIQVRA